MGRKVKSYIKGSKTSVGANGDWLSGFAFGAGSGLLIPLLGNTGILGPLGSMIYGFGYPNTFGSGLAWGGGAALAAAALAAMAAVPTLTTKGTTGISYDDTAPWRWWGCGAGLGLPARAVCALEQCGYPWPCGCGASNYFNQNSAW